MKFLLIKKLPEQTKQLLLNCFNWVVQNNAIPRSWSAVKIVAIQKPGKNPCYAESYRPIGLLSCYRKTLEKMIQFRLESWDEKNNILSPTQYGFRQSRSTRDCQVLLATDIQLAYTLKQELATVFLDIKGAYDSVLIDVLCKKMNNLGVPNQLG